MSNYHYPNAHKYCYECARHKYNQCEATCDDMLEHGYCIREGLKDCFVEKYCFECNEFEPFKESYGTAKGKCKVNNNTVWAYGECEINYE